MNTVWAAVEELLTGKKASVPDFFIETLHLTLSAMF